MPAAAAPMTRKTLNEKIVALAWKDEAFRKAFLADPKGQFEKRLGTKLAPGLSIAAYAEDENHLHFVIPAKPAAAAELSETDLERVAGGIDLIVTVSVTAALAAGGSVIGFGVGTLVDDNNRAQGKDHWIP